MHRYCVQCYINPADWYTFGNKDDGNNDNKYSEKHDSNTDDGNDNDCHIKNNTKLYGGTGNGKMIITMIIKIILMMMIMIVIW